ncbi:hypothetical protein U1Q18_044240 [Sarracenia purpurea var. burkii]
MNQLQQSDSAMNKIHPKKHILLRWRPVVKGFSASEQDPPASDLKIFRLEFESNHFRRWNAVAYYCSSPSEETKEEQSPSTPVMIRFRPRSGLFERKKKLIFPFVP